MKKNFVTSYFAICTFLTALAFVSVANADVYLITDFDGTWTGEDAAEGGREGTWSTYYTLYRIQEPSHAAIEIPRNLPIRIHISPYDYENIRVLLAQADNISGSTEPYTPHNAVAEVGGPKLTSIIPGYYRVINPISFERFRGGSNAEGGSHLAEDYLAAVAEAKKSPKRKSHRGRGEELIQHFLNNSDLASTVRVLTARGADDADWAELFAAMQKVEGYKYVPATRARDDQGPAKGVWALGSLEFSGQLGRTIVEKKLKYLEYLAFKLMKQSPRELVLSPDGETYDYYHTIIFQDNDPDYLLPVFKRFRELATSKRFPIKFVMRNVGTEEQVEQTKWFVSNHDGAFNGDGSHSMKALRDIVIQSDGRVRAATPEDLFIDPRTVKEAKGLLTRRFKVKKEKRIGLNGPRAFVESKGDDCEKSLTGK